MTKPSFPDFAFLIEKRGLSDLLLNSPILCLSRIAFWSSKRIESGKYSAGLLVIALMRCFLTVFNEGD